jgi:cystathionine gamma-synthase
MLLERSARINHTAEAFAEWLRSRPEVQHVYYTKNARPGYVTQVLLCVFPCGIKLDILCFRQYEAIMRPQGGYGGLLSFVCSAACDERVFYDAVQVPKGPSLGTNYTLCCPYTLLVSGAPCSVKLRCKVITHDVYICAGMTAF